MRTLRQVCAASVLTFILALSAFAGEIQTTIVSQPPSPPPSGQETTAGQMGTGSAGEIETTVTVTDAVTQATRSLIQGVLSLI